MKDRRGLHRVRAAGRLLRREPLIATTRKGGHPKSLDAERIEGEEEIRHATARDDTGIRRIGWAVRRTPAVWPGRGPGAPDTAPFRQDVLPCGRAGLRQG